MNICKKTVGKQKNWPNSLGTLKKLVKSKMNVLMGLETTELQQGSAPEH
jgi:hypothetical protein